MPSRPKPGEYPRSQEFTKNSENLSELVRLGTQFERLHKRAIRSGSRAEMEALAACSYFYLGVEAEARLRKIVSEPTGFVNSDRLAIRSKRSQLDRWMLSVDLSFGRHYDALIDGVLAVGKLHPDALSKRESIRGMLSGDLRPVIESRNKIAHGQPLWQLKSQSENEFKSSSAPLKYGDYWDIKYRRVALSMIGEIVLTLVVSQPAFERDFQKQTAAFDAAKASVAANHDGSQYLAFVQNLSKPVIVRSNLADSSELRREEQSAGGRQHA